MRKPKFRVGQVVKTRSGDGEWMYGYVLGFDNSNVTVALEHQIEQRYLRPLTAREYGRRASKGSK